MSGPLLSVVITNFNKADLIESAVRSALDQVDWNKKSEVVVVDDCSTDDSLRTLGVYSNRIRIVENYRNSGAMISTLAGVAAARGTYIVTLDGDDILAPNVLEMLVASDLLRPRRLIRGGIRHCSDPVASQRPIEVARIRHRLQPAWKLTMAAKTGGSSLVFPRQALLDLWGRFPGIAVQDHVIPELLSLRLDDYVRLDCITHFCYSGDAVGHLSSSSVQLHHDRLLCGVVVLRDAIELDRPPVLIERLRRRLIGRCLRYSWKYRVWNVVWNNRGLLAAFSHQRLGQMAESIACEMRLRYPAIRYYESELHDLNARKAA